MADIFSLTLEPRPLAPGTGLPGCPSLRLVLAEGRGDGFERALLEAQHEEQQAVMSLAAAWLEGSPEAGEYRRLAERVKEADGAYVRSLGDRAKASAAAKEEWVGGDPAGVDAAESALRESAFAAEIAARKRDALREELARLRSACERSARDYFAGEHSERVGRLRAELQALEREFAGGKGGSGALLAMLVLRNRVGVWDGHGASDPARTVPNHCLALLPDAAPERQGA